MSEQQKIIEALSQKKTPGVPIELDISNLSTFVAICTAPFSMNKSSAGYQTWFRGHASERWLLQPTLYRDKRFHEKGKNFKKTEGRLLNEFSILGHAFHKLEGTRELQHIARHHGLPSTLLDWTRDSLWALSSACELSYDSEGREEDGAVWILAGVTTFMDSDSKLTDYIVNIFEESKAPLMIMPKLENSRIKGQSGGFLPFYATEDDNYAELTKWLSTYSNFDRKPLESVDPKKSDVIKESNLQLSVPVLIKLKIKAASKLTLLKQIRALGFSLDRVFPDLDGVVRELTSQWILRNS